MFGKFYKYSIRNNQINLLYSVYSCEIELNFVFQYDDLFHQNESLCEIPFLGWISPIQVYWLFGRWEWREEIYWWITEIWTNVKLWENLTKQIFLWQTDYLWTENTQCNAVGAAQPQPSLPPTPHHSQHFLL